MPPRAVSQVLMVSIMGNIQVLNHMTTSVTRHRAPRCPSWTKGPRSRGRGFGIQASRTAQGEDGWEAGMAE